MLRSVAVCGCDCADGVAMACISILLLLRCTGHADWPLPVAAARHLAWPCCRLSCSFSHGRVGAVLRLLRRRDRRPHLCAAWAHHWGALAARTPGPPTLQRDVCRHRQWRHWWGARRQGGPCHPGLADARRPAIAHEASAYVRSTRQRCHHSRDKRSAWQPEACQMLLLLEASLESIKQCWSAP